MGELEFNKIEKKWQSEWEKAKCFEAKEDAKKKKYYVLEMFPYPSGAGLHMGHALNYTIGDIQARFKRMKGFNVLYPMGYDSFGLPAENAAIKAHELPKDYTSNSIANFIKQQKALGLSYDWNRKITTCEPEYYKWNQYFFIKLYEKGLVYRKKSAVNWCPNCHTVLANEQVHNGKCWRHEDTDVEIKQLEQWFIKTTEYSEELLEDIKNLNWPERIKIMQENWIGKSKGTEINFEINSKNDYLILHGYGASSTDNFYQWVKKELEGKGHKVTVPDMPNSESPNVNEQVKFILKHQKFNENSVILGHSLGSVIALKVIEQLKKPIKKLVLAAGFIEPKFKDKLTAPFEKTFDWKFDFDKIKKNVRQIVILRDAKDHAVQETQADRLKEKLDGDIIDFEAEHPHICGEREPVVLDSLSDYWPVFTTRPDTVFGVTFMVVSAQHSKLNLLISEKQNKDVEKFLKKIKSVSEKEMEDMEKEGVFTGSYAINPLTKEEIPIYAGNFVAADYGGGMVMAVPTHDQRDFEFAKKYKLPMKLAIQNKEKNLDVKSMKEAYTGDGTLVNSGKFSGTNNREAIELISEHIENSNLGRRVTNYKFRDWLISRQRYWGTPIPMVYCEKCGVVPVPEKELPVKLPDRVKFGEGNPLETNKEFVSTKCPNCKGNARRETDTMDTFFDSSWYYLRYCDNHNNKMAFEKKKAEYWMPVDQYIGGAEHACMHLIYARFFTKALRDMGLLKFDEPFPKLFNQGMLHGSDGNKMSKSLGNVINPIEMTEKYSADSLRLNLMTLAAPDNDSIWSDNGMEASFKVVRKIAEFIENYPKGDSSAMIESKTNKAVKEISGDIENFKYNLAIIKLRNLFEAFEKEKGLSKNEITTLLKMLSVFCPHISEELWHKLGNKTFISLEEWPIADESKINPELEKQEQQGEQLISDINNIARILKEKQNTEVKRVYVYTLPKEKENYNPKELSEKLSLAVTVYSVADKNKHDPQNKAGKAKPGKPAIYVE